MRDEDIKEILDLANVLEECEFRKAWEQIDVMHRQCSRISGFNDSIRKFVCHVVGITFQTIHRSLLIELLGGDMQVNGKFLKMQSYQSIFCHLLKSDIN